MSRAALLLRMLRILCGKMLSVHAKCSFCLFPREFFSLVPFTCVAVRRVFLVWKRETVALEVGFQSRYMYTQLNYESKVQGRVSLNVRYIH